MKGFIETNTGELVSVKHIESIAKSDAIPNRQLISMQSGRRIINDGDFNKLTGKIHAALL